MVILRPFRPFATPSSPARTQYHGFPLRIPCQTSHPPPISAQRARVNRGCKSLTIADCRHQSPPLISYWLVQYAPIWAETLYHAGAAMQGPSMSSTAPTKKPGQKKYANCGKSGPNSPMDPILHRGWADGQFRRHCLRLLLCDHVSHRAEDRQVGHRAR